MKNLLKDIGNSNNTLSRHDQNVLDYFNDHITDSQKRELVLEYAINELADHLVDIFNADDETKLAMIRGLSAVVDGKIVFNHEIGYNEHEETQ